MVKRRIKVVTGSVLLALMSLGLIISTLHSHHNLELHNSPDFADTGHCLNVDTTICPICAHLIKIDTSGNSETGNIFYNVEVVIPKTDDSFTDFSFVVNKGRSPPLTV